MGLWTDANEMFLASKHLATDKRFEFSQPLYFLLGHAIELSFKSYLLARGESLERLKRIGHDLNVCLDEAEKAGIVDLVHLSPTDRALVTLMNRSYKSKEFEYRVTGAKSIPFSADLIGLLERILHATRALCSKSL